MSETMLLPPGGEIPVQRTPTVYFIDDSATMREVIKIAFRRENIQVITCPDAASALAQFEQTPPDVVITDVIMPDQDGYSVCSQIREHPQFSSVPVILMSGVVNKAVADRAVAVKADDLIRKPFQPQELIGRVKSLLNPKDPAAAPQSSQAADAASALSSLFAPAAASPAAPPFAEAPAENRAAESAWPQALADAFSQHTASPSSRAAQPASPSFAMPQRPASPSANDVQRLRIEIMRLELLVKKLRTELQIEREYIQSLELHIRALQQS